MPVVGFNLEKAAVEKKKPLQKGMQARHNITIVSVKPEDIVIGENSKKPGLRFSFEYEVDYQPEIGRIDIAGHILYLDDEKTIKNIMKQWDKEKKMTPELTSKILNTAIIKCTIKALNLSQDVNLPPHLPIPTISPAPITSKEQDYIG